MNSHNIALTYYNHHHRNVLLRLLRDVAVQGTFYLSSTMIVSDLLSSPLSTSRRQVQLPRGTAAPPCQGYV